MALVNFTQLDFDQIKNSIKDYLRSNPNFTDYDFEGSNLSSIIDLLAYNTYITSYNANMVSNEVFIDSATLRENVVSLARNIGYVPRSKKASIANISFFVDTTDLTSKPTTLTLKKGVVCTSTNAFLDQSFSFTIPQDITRPVVNGIASFMYYQLIRNPTIKIRYIDWVLTTPLLLYELSIIQEITDPVIQFIIQISNLFMFYFGWLGEKNRKKRLFYCLLGFIPLCIIFYLLYKPMLCHQQYHLFFHLLLLLHYFLNIQEYKIL